MPPALWPLVRILFTSILRSGHFPATLPNLHLIFLDKPGNNPEQRAGRRPISVFRALSEAPESAIPKPATGGNVEGAGHAAVCLPKK